MAAGETVPRGERAGDSGSRQALRVGGGFDLRAYLTLLERCSSDLAPWYVVPADRTWYARLAVQRLLLETLGERDLSWPPADFDVAAEKVRLAAT